MYQTGQCVPKDYEEAIGWTRLAAEQGDPIAQFNMSGFYLFGHGVPEDYVTGHKWLNLAAASGHDKAGEIRDAFEKDMTREQIAEAQRLAREWWQSSR